MPAAHWGAELALVDMYLQKDGRNCTSFPVCGLLPSFG